MMTITVDDSKAELWLKQMPTKVREALLAKVTTLAAMLEGYIKSDKLQGQVLNHRTGALQRSIHSSTSSSATSVQGIVASSGDVKYAAIHEFGGTTPPHIIEAKNAKALAFLRGGKMVYYKLVHHPGSKMPERSFMRSALADKREEIIAGLKEAVQEGVQK